MIYLLGLGGGGGGGGGEVSTVSTASGIVTFFFRSFALVLGTLIALGFFVLGDCDFFDALEKLEQLYTNHIEINRTV